MSVKFLLLALCCYIAFTRPVWGVSILLILTSSLFHLSKYVTVPLPVGYIGAYDVLFLALLAGAYRKSRFKSGSFFSFRKGFRSINEDNGSGRTEKTLITAIVPFLVWSGICGVHSIFVWENTSSATVALRGISDSILPWSIVAVIWLLRDKNKEIIRAMIIIATITALAHIAIQVLDLRSIVPAAYWTYADESHAAVQYEFSMLEVDDFVRYLPQGLALMLLCYVYCFSKYLLNEHPAHNRNYLAVTAIQLVAFLTTFSRAIIAIAVWGAAMAIFLPITMRAVKRESINRATVAIGTIVLLGAIFITANPEKLDFWFDRFANLGEDSKIFSEETTRGQNNLGAIDAIKASPIWGWGSTLVPDKYRHRFLERNHDTHSVLAVALLGGITGLILLIRLFFIILKYFVWYSKKSLYHRETLLPYFAVFGTVFFINLCGSGCTLIGVGLTAMTLFIGLMAAETTSCT